MGVYVYVYVYAYVYVYVCMCVWLHRHVYVSIASIPLCLYAFMPLCFYASTHPLLIIHSSTHPLIHSSTLNHPLLIIHSSTAQATVKEDSGITLRQFLSYATITSLIYFMIQIMLTFRYMKDHASEVYGDSLLRFYPIILYSILPTLFSSSFGAISENLNKFENHSTKVEAENSLILKHFALEFCNRYCALFYAAFWLRDLDQLRSLLVSLLTTNSLINNFMEVGLPFIKKWSKQRKQRLGEGDSSKPPSQPSSNPSSKHPHPLPATPQIPAFSSKSGPAPKSPEMHFRSPKRFIPGTKYYVIYRMSYVVCRMSFYAFFICHTIILSFIPFSYVICHMSYVLPYCHMSYPTHRCRGPRHAAHQ
jgi:hypothetical protein